MHEEPHSRAICCKSGKEHLVNADADAEHVTWELAFSLNSDDIFDAQTKYKYRKHRPLFSLLWVQRQVLHPCTANYQDTPQKFSPSAGLWLCILIFQTNNHFPHQKGSQLSISPGIPQHPKATSILRYSSTSKCIEFISKGLYFGVYLRRAMNNHLLEIT